MKFSKRTFSIIFISTLFLLYGCASSETHKKTTSQLIRTGDRLMKENKFNEALYNYWKAKDYEKIKKAVGAGANVNLPVDDSNPNYNMTMLSKAVMDRDDTTVNFLISLGADVNAKDSNNSTPLHNATFYYGKNTKNLNILIANGADVNAKGVRNFTPLDMLKFSFQNASSSKKYPPSVLLFIQQEVQYMEKFLIQNGAKYNVYKE